MRFEDRNDGEYLIHAGALELRAGHGHLAAVIVVRNCTGSKCVSVFRDVAISGGHRWLTSDQALQQAFVSGYAAIAAERHRVEPGTFSSPPSISPVPGFPERITTAAGTSGLLPA